MQSLTYGLKPVPFKNRDTRDYFNKLLDKLPHHCMEQTLAIRSPGVCAVPPFSQSARKGWGTRHPATTPLHGADARYSLAWGLCCPTLFAECAKMMGAPGTRHPATTPLHGADARYSLAWGLCCPTLFAECAKMMGAPAPAPGYHAIAWSRRSLFARLGFVLSHPFRRVREKDGAPGTRLPRHCMEQTLAIRSPGVCAAPPFSQSARKGWGTRHPATTPLHGADARYSLAWGLCCPRFSQRRERIGHPLQPLHGAVARYSLAWGLCCPTLFAECAKWMGAPSVVRSRSPDRRVMWITRVRRHDGRVECDGCG